MKPMPADRWLSRQGAMADDADREEKGLSSVIDVLGLAGPDTEDEESLCIDEVVLAGERGEEIALRDGGGTVESSGDGDPRFRQTQLREHGAAPGEALADRR